MLDRLKISNLAVIQEVEVEFKSGLNILSGETGAGKSIVIQAVGLLLGERAHAELIRAGAAEGSVEGLFDIGKRRDIRSRLEKHGFTHSDQGELHIKRIVAQNGKHRAYVNGGLCTLSVLQEITEGLIDLCAQHEHQSLLRPSVQLELLDHYGGLGAQALEYSALFSHVRSIRSELEHLSTAEEERNRKLDFYKFQIEELDAANFERGEDERLAQEKALLQTAEKRLGLAHKVLECVSKESDGALLRIQEASSALGNLGELDPDFSKYEESLENARHHLNEVEYALSKYVSHFECDPNRLEEIQERLALMATLRRKYGTTVDEMLAHLDRMRQEAAELAGSDERRAELQSELAGALVELRKKVTKLSQARKSVAKVLGESVTSELKDLRMSDAKFEVKIATVAEDSQWTQEGGADRISFEICANRGEEAKALQKVASGGELSRLMLAMRRVISNQGGIGIYLFDEIDTGIGGQTAFEVGRKLKSVAGHSQVICITHLPQIACFANHHLSVEKQTKKGRTETRIIVLDIEKRSEEVARMLGGAKVTPSSLKNARELISQAVTA